MSKLKTLLLCGVALGLMFSPVVHADRYVVAPGTPGANPEAPYDAWAKAATNIQDAVDAATPGETIWVSNGTYKATGAGTLFRGVTTMVYIAKDVMLRSVNGPDVTTLDGGYPDITNRPVAVNSIGAVFSGFTVVNGRAGDGGGILLGNNGGMVSNCVVCSNVSDSALNVEGSYNSGGGGIASRGTGYVYNCSIYNNTAISNNGGGAWMIDRGVMRGCKFYANTSFGASYGGGGCYIREEVGEDIKISQCVFSNNATTGYGGGVHMYRGSIVLDDCSVVNNSSTNGGGGCFAYYGGDNALITNCVISENTTSGAGGGVQLRSSVKYFKIANCDIISNQTTAWGGGVESQSGEVVLTDCLIASNSARYGGGFYHYSTKTNVSEIMNCVIRENRVTYKSGGAGASLGGPCRMVGCLVASNVITTIDYSSTGAGIKITSDAVICENNTVVGNKTAGNGGGIYMSQAGQVNNTIIYGNTSRVGENQDWMATAGTFSNCCAADITGMNGSGNIAADPEFVDAAEGNYRLKVSSPCVNTGLNQDWMADGVDKDGRPRLDWFVKRVDIGCYEYQPSGTAFFLR